MKLSPMAHSVVLLDIDGVLVTNPSWRRAEILRDGFIEFNSRAASNLEKILTDTSAEIILTTSHRSNYSLSKWKILLGARGITANNIHKIDEEIHHTGRKRVDEILEWINMYGGEKNYVILDDDTSLDSLPPQYKKKWVKTLPLIGLDDEATNKALHILNDV